MLKKLITGISLIAAMTAAAVEPVTPKQAMILVETKSAILVDVRERDELVAKGQVKGARWLPKSDVDASGPEFRKFLETVPKSTPVVFYCGSGRRAQVVAERFEKLGYRAYNAGGLSDWIAAGYTAVPFVPPSKSPPSGSIEIPIQETTKALLVKVTYETAEPIKRLVPQDFRVRFDWDKQEFTLSREDQGGLAVLALTEDPRITSSCRQEIRQTLAPAVSAPRTIPGTAVILIHQNGHDRRHLKLGPALKLVSAQPLQ